MGGLGIYFGIFSISMFIQLIWKARSTSQVMHEIMRWYLALVLHLFGRSADDVYLGGREADGGVDWDVFGWSVAGENLHVSLESVKWTRVFIFLIVSYTCTHTDKTAHRPSSVWPLSGTWGSWPCVWAGRGPGRHRRRRCRGGSCAVITRPPPAASACRVVLSHRWSNSLNPASACNEEEQN